MNFFMFFENIHNFVLWLSLILTASQLTIYTQNDDRKSIATWEKLPTLFNTQCNSAVAEKLKDTKRNKKKAFEIIIYFVRYIHEHNSMYTPNHTSHGKYLLNVYRCHCNIFQQVYTIYTVDRRQTVTHSNK